MMLIMDAVLDATFVTYMGSIVDHSSNLSDPVALSSAEAEYNEGCLAMMATSHLRMLLAKLEGTTEDALAPTIVYFDSRSAIAMGNSFCNTKHTRHILCHYRYVQDGIASKSFIMQWLKTFAQLVDIGTKINPRPRQSFLVNLNHTAVTDLITKVIGNRHLSKNVMQE
jgi:hypothetical protein